MVSSFKIIFLYLPQNNNNNNTNDKYYYATMSIATIYIPAVMISVLWFLLLSTRGQTYPVNPLRLWCVYLKK